MPKLHIVGISADHKGLILSERARAKSGDLVLEIGDDLISAIDEARRRRIHDEANTIVSAALPTRRDGLDTTSGRQSRLSPREIQRRLRMGESIGAVARRAAVEEAWVDKFAPPVFAEQARVVERAQRLVYSRPRVGLSGAPLGDSVMANLADRGIRLTISELDDGWKAYQRRDDVWCVRFEYSARNRKQTAEWDLYADTGELVARNRLASELAYLDPRRRRRRIAPLPDPETAKTPASTSPARQAGRATAKKAAGRSPAKKRTGPAKKKVAPARKKTAPTRKKAAPAKRAPAKRAPAKRAPAKRTAAKRAPAKRTAAKRAPAKRTAAKRAPAKRTAAKRAPARRTAAKRAPAKRTAAKRARRR
jgi:hypothetical protein